MQLLSILNDYWSENIPLLIILILAGVFFVILLSLVIFFIVKRKKTAKQAPVQEVEEEQALSQTEEPKNEEEPTKEEGKEPAKKTATPSTVPTTPVKYGGKWVISKENESYFFILRASNGEKLLRSGNYSSLSGAKSGIETYRNNIQKGNFKIVQTKSGDFIYQLLNARGTLLAYGEDYKLKTRCESAIESTKRFASTATIEIEEVKENQ